MNINSHTYEAFLLDFAEGRLTAEEIILLEAFIQAHPELGSWEELTEDLPVLIEEELLFVNKSRLKAPFLPEQPLSIKAENFDSFAIAYLDNELDLTEKLAFERFLETDKTHQRAFLILQKTILKPDKSIQFNGKEELKIKAGRTVALFMPWIGVAAGLLLLISVGWWFASEDTKPSALPEAVHTMSSIKPKQIYMPQTTEQAVRLVKPEIKNPGSRIPEINFTQQNEIPAEMTFAQAKPFSWTPVASLFYTDDSKTLFYFYDGASILAELNEQTVQNQKSLAGLILSNATSKFLQSFRSTETMQEPVIVEFTANNPAKNSLIKLAEAGIKTFNTMTDNELALEKTLNTKGEISRLRFRSESISISRQYKPQKAE
ncbi:MAG: hypothetical protein RBR87_10055 [Bacteroidales bacterium]|jgi:hypothetical protein|nr:hypothetical protein [Bacteroidales bacterium]